MKNKKFFTVALFMVLLTCSTKVVANSKREAFNMGWNFVGSMVDPEQFKRFGEFASNPNTSEFLGLGAASNIAATVAIACGGMHLLRASTGAYNQSKLEAVMTTAGALAVVTWGVGMIKSVKP